MFKLNGAGEGEIILLHWIHYNMIQQMMHVVATLERSFLVMSPSQIMGSKCNTLKRVQTN